MKCDGCGIKMKEDQEVQGDRVLVGYVCFNKRCPDYEGAEVTA